MFELSPTGEFTLLHSLAGRPSEGNGPAGTLVLDPLGDLFGTTYAGGATNRGEPYSSIPPAAAIQLSDPSTLVAHCPGPACICALYGTTTGGYASFYGMYGGTVFEAGVKHRYTLSREDRTAANRWAA